MLQKAFGVLFVLVLGTYLLTSTPARSQDDQPPRAKRWRHLALTYENQRDAELAQQINKLGSDGWELVDVENFESKGETVKTVYYFKTPE